MPLLVVDRLGQRLPDRDPDILDGVVRIDMQITLRFDLEIDQAMTCDLIQHVIEKRDAGRRHTARFRRGSGGP